MLARDVTNDPNDKNVSKMVTLPGLGLNITFSLAYEFPKPADDIKDAQVPNVDAIRGGLSFRGLMRQRAGATVRNKRFSLAE